MISAEPWSGRLQTSGLNAPFSFSWEQAPGTHVGDSKVCCLLVSMQGLMLGLAVLSKGFHLFPVAQELWPDVWAGGPRRFLFE
jgi:hypothetical protein